ncbi:MAG: hypothetical protein AAF984_01245 [Verrucomicrobiota bacterium]
MKYFIIVIIIAGILVLVLPEGKDYVERELTSGESIKELQIKEINTYEHGPMLKVAVVSAYELKLGHYREEVRDEALKIWESYFKKRVDEEGYRNALIQMHDNKQPIIFLLKKPVRNFIFRYDPARPDLGWLFYWIDFEKHEKIDSETGQTIYTKTKRLMERNLATGHETVSAVLPEEE